MSVENSATLNKQKKSKKSFPKLGRRPVIVVQYDKEIAALIINPAQLTLLRGEGLEIRAEVSSDGTTLSGPPQRRSIVIHFPPKTFCSRSLSSDSNNPGESVLSQLEIPFGSSQKIFVCRKAPLGPFKLKASAIDNETFSPDYIIGDDDGDRQQQVD